MRAIWSGMVSFGLVNIPVKLQTAVNADTYSMNYLRTRTQYFEGAAGPDGRSITMESSFEDPDRGDEKPFRDQDTGLQHPHLRDVRRRKERQRRKDDGDNLYPSAIGLHRAAAAKSSRIL